MKKSNFIRSVVFLLLVGVLLYGLCDLFEYKSDYIAERFNTYDKLEEDTVDVVLIGTSAIDRYWIASKAFDESGITAYPYSSDGTAVYVYMSMLKQATKNQSPKLVVFDMRPFTVSYDTGKVNDVYARKVIDALDFFSLSRFDAINRTLKVMNKYDEDGSLFDASYFFSFIKYHSMWESSMSFDELGNPESDYMGFFVHSSFSTKKVEHVANDVVTDKRTDLDELCLDQLNELLDYAKDEDFEVLFIDNAHAHTALQAERINTLCDILDERGISYYIDEYNEDNYDIENDFYNDGHVNYYGAERFTERFQEYLTENYDLPDHRQDERCAQWVGIYDSIKDEIASIEKSKD